MERRKHELPGAPPGAECTIELDGKRLSARVGEPLMVALVAHGIETASRSVKYHRPRGAFCMSGVCGQCWMRIDDLPNRPACVTPCHDGMVASRENAFPSADFDLFRAADKIFGALDHHRLGTTPFRPFNLVVQESARRMAGLGELSTQPPKPALPAERKKVDVVVVGAGPAGLAAAQATASAGLSTLVVEARRVAGGQLETRLWDDVPALAGLPTRTMSALDAMNGELWRSSIACGVFLEEGRDRPELLVVRSIGRDDARLVLVDFASLVLANGGYEQTPLFESNDLPGHYGARALAELALGHHVLPGQKVVIADGGTEAGTRLHAKLASLGARVVRVVEDGLEESRDDLYAGHVIVAARGGTHVKGVELAPKGREQDEGARKKLPCDVIASAMPVAPAFELGRQIGCDIDHRPDEGGFAIAIDPATGQTSVPRVFAAGDVAGAKSPSYSMIQGELAGLSAVLAVRDDATARARRHELVTSLAAPSKGPGPTMRPARGAR
ncbi:2Fe-2S iron-sulfur cluster-binding protein [Myxococcota bacterium]|nr:2Fe-2S iron-sulfur cluster-binding protein [Myxococcota bacterium]